eukprot:TRINITY_DN4076_c0_g1_i1.p1 TRINITY_DN4076_c0_g1~~TRINITY_DN4076_c0_g1_i1.p1  ORF type:complete len:359 (-),score=152.09 TRINITY_DN4076_c0_g1_i1:180-1256(-)
MTSVIARRLSFGASKVGFPIGKYLSQIDELSVNNFTCVGIANDYDPTIERDLHELKRYFKTLKFNYFELYSKQRFLENLNEDPSTWSQPSTLSVGEMKEKYKEVKASTDEVIQRLKEIIDDLSKSYEIFKDYQSKLKKELEEVSQIINSHIPDPEREQPKPSLKRGLEQNLSAPERANLFSQMNATLSGMVMLKVLSVDPDSITIRFCGSHTGIVRFAEGTLAIDSFELTPADIPTGDLVMYGKESGRLSSLVIEVRARILNFANRKKEIHSLSSQGQYDVSHYDEEKCTATVQLGKIKAEADLLFSIDYPQDFARILVRSLTGENQETLDEIKGMVNKEHFSLVPLLQKIEELASFE